MWQNGCCWRLLALPLAELAAFIAVAAAYGFFLALALVLAGSLAGGLILRHAGGNHIARVRVAMNQGLEQGSLPRCRPTAPAALILLPEFSGYSRAYYRFSGPFAAAGRRSGVVSGQAWRQRRPPARNDGVVDLEPEQWRRVDDPALPGHGRDTGSDPREAQ